MTQLSPEVIEISTVSRIENVNGQYSLKYRVYGDGTIFVSMEGQAKEVAAAPEQSNQRRRGPGRGQQDGMPEIPRFGMRMAMPAGFETIRWFGRGPQETYWDRCDARVDLYQGTVDEQLFDYSQPTETGNKADVRWVALTNNNGLGLLAVGMPTLSVNAMHYTAEDLTSDDRTGPSHLYEVPRRDEVYLNLDYRQMGVGGDNSWGARTHQEFTLPGDGKYSYSFFLCPYESSIGNIQKIVQKTKSVTID
jgi:beta-galactosidase